jgi:hypothetical protein
VLRLRVLLAISVLSLSAIALAACGSGEEDPQDVLAGASFEGIESADFDLSLSIESQGKEGGDVDVDLSGRAQSEGIEVDVKVAGTAQGKAVDFEGGLTLLAKHGFVNYQGTEYEIDPSNYSFAKPLFFPALSKEGRVDIAACKEAAAAITPGSLADDLRNDGTVEVVGAETTKVSGTLDVPAAVEAVIDLVEELGCSAQFEALSPFPLYKIRRIGDELATSVEKAELEVYVGDDGIIRKLSAKFTADPSGDPEPVAVDLEITLSAVNADQKIEVPSQAKPLQVLFTKLGINPFEFLSWSRGGEGVRSLGEKVAADAFP